MNIRERKDYITLLNVCAAMAVVFLHVNNDAYTDFYNDIAYWSTANIIRSVFYFAVPVFFMISGANLLDYNQRYTSKEYALKRLKKVVIPFLFWSCIGFVYYINFENPDMEINLSNFLNGLLNSWFVGTYWFFIPLFIVYLAIPLFAAIPMEKKTKIYTYLVITGFLVNILIPFLIKIFDIQIVFNVNFWPVSGYIIYALLGYVLDRVELKKEYRIIIYILGLICLWVDIYGTYMASGLSWKIDETFSGYLNVPCFFYSIAVFVFFKYVLSALMKHSLINKTVNRISRYCFGIYLLHRGLLGLLKSLNNWNYMRTGYLFNIYSLSFEIGASILIILICIPIIFLIRKIPVLRATLP